MTPQIADIVAIQNLYGVGTARSGNTVYGLNTTETNPVYALNSLTTYPSGAPALTIFDASGTDTLDLSFYTANQTIDLRPEALSSIGGYLNNWQFNQEALAGARSTYALDRR